MVGICTTYYVGSSYANIEDKSVFLDLLKLFLINGRNHFSQIPSTLHIAFGSIMFSIMTGGIVGVSALAPRSISLCAMGNILLIMHKKTMLYVQAGYLNNGPYM